VKVQSVQVFSADGKHVVGEVIGDRFVKWARSRTQMLRIPPAWACDVSSLLSAEAMGARFVEIHDLDTDRVYVAALNLYWECGQQFNRGCGKQVGLELSYWEITGGPTGSSRPSRGTRPPTGGPHHG
jgi:hypothetical protein